MFRKTATSRQANIFTSPGSYLGKSSLKYYDSATSWHNQFCNNVVNKIDESTFSVLFDENNGAPNASLRVLVGMMIIKEGQGWSDEQLFENCRYNLLVRRALGLFNLDDAVPSPSTYYLFRHNIVAYNAAQGKDLLKQCQAQITRNQLVEYNVSGKRVRMDSKLLGSNIKWYSRYELIHETLRQAIKESPGAINRLELSEEESALVKSIAGESGEKAIYRSTKEEIDRSLVALGELVHRIVTVTQLGGGAGPAFQTLKSVFEQQYDVAEDKSVHPKSNKALSAQSIQSPHDTDCTYRSKDDQQVKGYSVNVTETCNASPESGAPVLNLITDVQVAKATQADNAYLEEAIAETSKLLPDQIESVNADGAYHSPENQSFCMAASIVLLLSALQGARPGYDLVLDEAGNLNITDLEHKTTIIAQPVKPRKKTSKEKWKIRKADGKYRYFDRQSIATAALRRKMKDVPIEELTRRNNVEATIFQMGYHYSNNKSRYRTLAKHKLWAYSRALWINHVRIAKYVALTSKNLFFSLKSAARVVNNSFYTLTCVMSLFVSKLNLSPQKKLSWATF